MDIIYKENAVSLSRSCCIYCGFFFVANCAQKKLCYNLNNKLFCRGDYLLNLIILSGKNKLRVALGVSYMSKPKVYLTRKLTDQAMEYLSANCELRYWDGDDAVPREVLLREVRDVEGILSMLADPMNEEVFKAAPKLKVVSNMAVGFDNIDVPLATNRGIMVSNTPGVLTEATADMAWALLMASARRIGEADKLVRAGEWQGWSPLFMCGQDVYGSTLGIIGMGRIGLAVARRAKGFGMQVIYNKRNRDLEAEQELGLQYVSLEDLLKNSDYVSVHCPLTPETKHMLGEKEFAMMKPTAILVNTARGAVIDEEAMYRALRDKLIWAAGLDVFNREPISADHPLLALNNVVVAPHLGSATYNTRSEMAMISARAVIQGVTGHVPEFLLNPEYQYHSNR
jgi:glyoxylate reductase